MNGWIKIHKSLSQHWIWSDPFALRAWLDLLICANYEDKKILFDGQLITVQRGQLITSVRKLSQKWGCSKERTRRILKLLEKDEMVHIDTNTRRTLLTIVNYGFYQDTCDSNEDRNKDTDEDTERTLGGHSADTDSPQHKKEKNNKELKEVKKDIYTSDIAEVLDYLNSRTGKKFTGKSKAHRQHIVARLKEGFTVEDFKKVIDNKVAAWGHSEKMAPYLRPETLFSSKFETYLNDVETERQKQKREEREIHEQQLKAIRMASDFDVGFLQ